MRNVLKSKLTWLNFLISIILYDLSMGKNIFKHSLVKIFNLEDIGLALYAIITLLITYIFVMAINFSLLIPINLLFNRVSKNKDIVYKYYSVLLLAPCFMFMLLKSKFDLGPESSTSSVFIATATYLYLSRAKTLELKTWCLIILCFFISAAI